ncbi:cuticle protein 16.5-like [Anopheles maculipalpis]|uniref:cuticle protein 16.5-like n=1 Tax=Anopheles maculipalpis TaxID=1496333 RepID=UPI002158CF30|nr:cuticle protein 16.5-like [Anopheles maculipalpis]
MAVMFVRALVLLTVACMLSGIAEAGLASTYLAAPVAVPVATAYTVPTQGVLRTAYNQVVGRSYAPSFVPVASSLAYAAAPLAAPVVKAVPTVYAAPPQLVAGPVLKTVRPYAVEAPLAYAAPAVAAVAPVVRAAAVPAPFFTPSVLSTRLAPLPAVGVAPAISPAIPSAPAPSLPGVIDARSATPVASAAPAPIQRSFVTAFGSQAGIRLVAGGAAFEGASTNVEIARAAPGGQDDAAQQGARSANPAAAAAPAPATQENFGVQQQTPFNEYGLPVPAGTPVNP